MHISLRWPQRLCFFQVSVKYRVDPRDDHDMLEGCPLLKQLAGRRYVPVGLHVGRFAGARVLPTVCSFSLRGLMRGRGRHCCSKGAAFCFQVPIRLPYKRGRGVLYSVFAGFSWFYHICGRIKGHRKNSALSGDFKVWGKMTGYIFKIDCFRDRAYNYCDKVCGRTALILRLPSVDIFINSIEVVNWDVVDLAAGLFHPIVDNAPRKGVDAPRAPADCGAAPNT